MAVDVSGSPPGGVDISGEGSEGCTGHQRIRRIQRPGLAPLQPHCVGRDSRTRSGYGLPIHGTVVLRWSYPKLPHLARKWCVFICFWGSFEEKACKSSLKKLHWPLWWYLFKGCRPCRRPRKNRQGSKANWHKNSSVFRSLRLSTFFLCILLWNIFDRFEFSCVNGFFICVHVNISDPMVLWVHGPK